MAAVHQWINTSLGGMILTTVSSNLAVSAAGLVLAAMALKQAYDIEKGGDVANVA